MLPAKTSADDPARHVRDRTELISDPKAEAEAARRFKDVSRDEALPGTPIITIVVRDKDELDDDGLVILAKLPYLRSVVTGGVASNQQVRSLARLRQVQNLYLYTEEVRADNLRAPAPLVRLRLPDPRQQHDRR